MATSPVCRKCGSRLNRLDAEVCPGCGAPMSEALPVPHDDAVREFEHHESILQNYRSMFLVVETFTASLAATRTNVPGSETLITLLAAFGLAWLVIWIIVTDLRSRVVRFFEEHDEDGALMRYHHQVEHPAHRAGFWFFTVVFPVSFAAFWLFILLLAYGVIQ